MLVRSGGGMTGNIGRGLYCLQGILCAPLPSSRALYESILGRRRKPVFTTEHRNWALSLKVSLRGTNEARDSENNSWLLPRTGDNTRRRPGCLEPMSSVRALLPLHCGHASCHSDGHSEAGTIPILHHAHSHGHNTRTSHEVCHSF